MAAHLGSPEFPARIRLMTTSYDLEVAGGDQLFSLFSLPYHEAYTPLKTALFFVTVLYLSD